eukprot:3356711-Rhodomonas_salina.6
MPSEEEEEERGKVSELAAAERYGTAPELWKFKNLNYPLRPAPSTSKNATAQEANLGTFDRSTSIGEVQTSRVEIERLCL